MAASNKQEQMLWRMRESIPEAHKQEGLSFKHDSRFRSKMLE
jgi:hypothetical protein